MQATYCVIPNIRHPRIGKTMGMIKGSVSPGLATQRINRQSKEDLRAVKIPSMILQKWMCH